jgi:hypothetical protein
MAEIINHMPNILYSQKDIARLAPSSQDIFSPYSQRDFHQIQSVFGIALHMHQPTIPAAGEDLQTAGLISNLQYMMDHQDVGDNHNAPVFMNCYSRMSDIIRGMVDKGGHPRVMLDYSGNLLWGLRQMEDGRVLENLKKITSDARYFPYVEWLGTMWSHAVVSSTPIPDIKMHIMAWRKHFAEIFGEDAVKRVKGFSPPEMHLPIHPDVCFAYIQALKECGYEWILVQEHTVEQLDGAGIQNPHVPHRLIAKNSLGEEVGITAFIKTQGSDTKLVAQMQPYYEAKTLNHQSYCGQEIPPYVCQIGDGENGGVMMNEFPPAFEQAFNEIGPTGTVSFTPTEYVEYLKSAGVDASDFIRIQPVSQHRIWEVIEIGAPQAADDAIRAVHETDPDFDLEKGSWTNDKNWVEGYGDVLDPMRQLSVRFHQKYDGYPADQTDAAYHEAMLYLLLSQTSCFRYWGEGLWTEYAKELCRRGLQVLD